MRVSELKFTKKAQESWRAADEVKPWNERGGRTGSGFQLSVTSVTGEARLGKVTDDFMRK